jgi:DNA-binding response OmpR family regulator
MTRKILITESDVDTKLLLSSLLKRHYQIIFLSDAKLLLEGSFEKPDLFILNSQLPGVGILEVCRHLKSGFDTREIPILIISASEDVESLMEACPGDDFIRKPFSGSELLAKVQRAITTNITSK